MGQYSTFGRILFLALVFLLICSTFAFAGGAPFDTTGSGAQDWDPMQVQSPTKYLVGTTGEGENSIDRIVVPGRPPKTFRAAVVMAPAPNVGAGINVLSNVPAFDWSYGCSPTSAAMMMGYYDNAGFPNMYAGPTNGGVCPLTNSAWGTNECPLSATHQGYDLRTIRGHVDDYWRAYGNCDPDPFIGNWPEHVQGECTADFMGTSQSPFGNCDGTTIFYYYTDGSPLYDYIGDEPGRRDGCHGLKLFAESCGYGVTTNYSQYIYGYNGNTKGFTFQHFEAEIDAGRPVLIQVAGHTMVGYGYDDSSATIYIHDTWDHGDHQMTWAGSYSGLQHYGVTVLQLQPPTAGSIWYVSKNSPGPTHDGTSWATAYLTVQEGLNAASQRNWTTNVTILDGNQAGSVVTSPPGATASTVIDGFTVRNGTGTLVAGDQNGGGVYCASSSPTISNNRITGNSALAGVGAGGGIYGLDSAPTVSGNTITGNRANWGGAGIYCRRGSPAIFDNVVTNNTASGDGGGIYCWTSSFIRINNNAFVGNQAYYGGAITCWDVSSGTISGNTIYANSAAYGGGIDCYLSSASIVNNTVVGNIATGWGGGIFCASSDPAIANNIVAFNSSGIRCSDKTPSLRNNCVYGNTAYDYLGLTPGLQGVSEDPLFVNRTAGDFHLLAGSPCVDAGEDSVVQPGWLDMDRATRVQGAHVDIGADELDAPATPSFSPDAGAYESPRSVIVTCSTDGAVIHYTTSGVDPTESDPAVASGSAVPVDVSLVLKAKAWKAGWAPSKVKTAEYTIAGTTGTVVKPTFSPDGGVYTAAQAVTISCANSGATIRYTADGSEPTEASALYVGPIPITTTATL
ncbi:MAG: chitobiase/beta-hexosaminidase C-terminal domain-containing protein, partial [Armatimonadetes bacterium]|nr:chitobiase/beta-hexosaminidase C-terminal domain-containing protein [Armatimonadota bacterium]